MGLPNKEPIGRLEQMEAQIAELLAWKQQKEEFDKRWRHVNDRWLSTKEACKLLGISRNTLESRREKPGSLIEFKREGLSHYQYKESSLIAHAESRTLRKHIH